MYKLVAIKVQYIKDIKYINNIYKHNIYRQYIHIDIKNTSKVQKYTKI